MSNAKDYIPKNKIYVRFKRTVLSEIKPEGAVFCLLKLNNEKSNNNRSNRNGWKGRFVRMFRPS